jgi:transcription antitermination factor NusG
MANDAARPRRQRTARPSDPPMTAYREGDRVEVVSGPFEGFLGKVVGPYDDRGPSDQIKVLVDVHGRDSPVLLRPHEMHHAPGESST